jgi:hypothetical protein
VTIHDAALSKEFSKISTWVEKDRRARISLVYAIEADAWCNSTKAEVTISDRKWIASGSANEVPSRQVRFLLTLAICADTCVIPTGLKFPKAIALPSWYCRLHDLGL